MKKIKRIFRIILIFIVFSAIAMLIIKNQGKTPTQSPTESTTQTEQLSGFEQYKDQLTESEGYYLLFGKNSEEINYKKILAYDPATEEEYYTWQISETYYLNIFEDENANTLLRYVNTHFHLSIPYIDEYFESYGTQYSKEELENLEMYMQVLFDDGKYRYVKIDSHPDEGNAFIIFNPRYSGTYVIATNKNYKENDEIIKNKCTAKALYKDLIYEQKYVANVSKSTHGLYVNGDALVEIYSGDDIKIAQYKTSALPTVKCHFEHDVNIYVNEYCDDEICVNTLSIQTNNDSGYYYKVIPTTECYVSQYIIPYNDIGTINENINYWNLTEPDDTNTKILIENKLIKEETVFKN